MLGGAAVYCCDQYSIFDIAWLAAVLGQESKQKLPTPFTVSTRKAP
jgi:hypothetical protein